MKTFFQIIKTLLENRSSQILKAEEQNADFVETFGKTSPNFSGIVRNFQGGVYRRRSFEDMFLGHGIYGNKFEVIWRDGTRLEATTDHYETHFKWIGRKDGGPDNVHLPKRSSNYWKEEWRNPRPGHIELRQMTSGTFDEIYALKPGVYSLRKRVYQGESLQVEIWSNGRGGQFELIPDRDFFNVSWIGRGSKKTEDQENLDKALETRSRDYPVLRGRPRKTGMR